MSSVTDSGAGMHGASTSPDGRWLAVAANGAVRLWDLGLEREAAFLPLGRTTHVAFHPLGHELFSCGSSGIFRWSFQLEGNALEIGPCRQIPIRGTANQIAVGNDARRLAIVGGGGLILDLEDSSVPAIKLEHPVAGQIALSPDDRWAATATWNGYGVRVWDVQSGSLERELISEARTTHAQFSPDGRWLVTSSESDFRFWQVGSWELCRRIDAPENGRSLVFDRSGPIV